MQCTSKNQYRRSSINKAVLCIDRLKSWLVHEKKKKSSACTAAPAQKVFVGTASLRKVCSLFPRTVVLRPQRAITQVQTLAVLTGWSCLRPLVTTPKQAHCHLYSKHAKNVISPLFNSSLRFYGKSVEKKKHENPFRSKVHSENEKHFREQTH